MEDVNFIKLPTTEDSPPAKKKKKQQPPRKVSAEEEGVKRQNNVKLLAVLGEEDSSVKQLEELVFGAEDQLLERLVEVIPHRHPYKNLRARDSIDCGNKVVIMSRKTKQFW